MKNISSKCLQIASVCAFLLTSCSRSKFALDNTDPDAILDVTPQSILTDGLNKMNNNTFEIFYDFNDIRGWAQQWVPFGGNSASFGTTAANTNQRWSNFYTQCGPRFMDAIQTINKMPADEQAQYVYMKAMAGIPMAYYAFYVSDANGSIPYTQAFLARYTGLLTPIYNTQEALFDTLDAQLKAIVTILKTPQPVPQTMLNANGSANDIFYPGSSDYSPWIKVANTLRLKIAMRLMKQNPAKLTSIANELLSDPDNNLISSLDDEWVLTGATNYTNQDGSGNGTPGSTTTGEFNMVQFMTAKKDPRVRNFYQPSPLTKDMFDSAKAFGAIPTTVIWDSMTYRGQYADPAASSDEGKSWYLSQVKFRYKGGTISISLPSQIQQRLFYASYNGGAGLSYIPMITYADVCFMRAELKIRGLSNDPTDAQTLYNQGVTASVTDYDKWAKGADVVDYTALGSDEISTYLSQPGVAYNASTALEQVIDQAYINDYLCPNEAWALLKRTDFPSYKGKVMPLENMKNGDYPVTIMPRRWVINYPSPSDNNFTNATNAIDSMRLDPDFGVPTDISGRVWWDKK